MKHSNLPPQNERKRFRGFIYFFHRLTPLWQRSKFVRSLWRPAVSIREIFLNSISTTESELDTNAWRLNPVVNRRYYLTRICQLNVPLGLASILSLLSSTALVLMFTIFQRKGQFQLIPKGNILDSQIRGLLSCSNLQWIPFTSMISFQKAFQMINNIFQRRICHELCNLFFSEKGGNYTSLKLLGLFLSDLFEQSK